GRAPGGGEGPLSGPGHAPGARAGRAPAIRFRRHAQFRVEGRGRGGARVRRCAALVHPGRVAGRGGEPGRTPGNDDPCGDEPAGARPGRHFRWPAAPVHRHRGRCRPAGGSHRRVGRRRAHARRRRPCAGGGVNAALGLQPRASAARKGAAASQPRLALLGTGTVGAAFVSRYRMLQERNQRLPRFAWLANSRTVLSTGAALEAALEQAVAAPARATALQGWAEAEALREGDIVVDATASDLVANWHPEWLARGVNVVTANKLGHGGLLARSQAISEAQAASGARYGDAATVGAGLPVLRSLRA